MEVTIRILVSFELDRGLVVGCVLCSGVAGGRDTGMGGTSLNGLSRREHKKGFQSSAVAWLGEFSDGFKLGFHHLDITTDYYAAVLWIENAKTILMHIVAHKHASAVAG